MAKKRYAYTYTEDQLKRNRRIVPFLYFIPGLALYLGIHPLFVRDRNLAILITLIFALVVTFVGTKISFYLQDKYDRAYLREIDD